VNSTKQWVDMVGKEWCTEKNHPNFDRSLLIQYIEFCRKNFGSVMGSKYMWFIPSYNKSTGEKELTKACCLFYDVCSSLNNSNNHRELTNYEVMQEFATAGGRAVHELSRAPVVTACSTGGGSTQPC
jgi:hypothetical protein